MNSSDIRKVIQDYLDLIERGSGSIPENEELLIFLIDLLALSQHHIDFVFDNSEYPSPPSQDQGKLRQIITQRFPNYGYYNYPENIATFVGESSYLIGDAIDDILDIYIALFDVEWYWKNTSEANALWYFQFEFQSHWGTHLRGLQCYLHSFSYGD